MRERPFLFTVGCTVALLLGLVSLVSGYLGLDDPISSADGLTAWPNLITGALVLVAVAGLWLLKKWGLYVYIVAFAAHVALQVMLYARGTAEGRTVPAVTMLFLALVPLISLAVLIDMIVHSRKGLLS